MNAKELCGFFFFFFSIFFSLSLLLDVSGLPERDAPSHAALFSIYCDTLKVQHVSSKGAELRVGGGPSEGGWQWGATCSTNNERHNVSSQAIRERNYVRCDSLEGSCSSAKANGNLAKLSQSHMAVEVTAKWECLHIKRKNLVALCVSCFYFSCSIVPTHAIIDSQT